MTSDLPADYVALVHAARECIRLLRELELPGVPAQRRVDDLVGISDAAEGGAWEIAHVHDGESVTLR